MKMNRVRTMSYFNERGHFIRTANIYVLSSHEGRVKYVELNTMKTYCGDVTRRGFMLGHRCEIGKITLEGKELENYKRLEREHGVKNDEST